MKLPLESSLYRSLGETLPLAVFFKDLEGRFRYVNREFCQMSGRTEEEILGRTDYDLCTPEDAEKFRADDACVLASGEMLHVVEYHPARDGRARHLEIFRSAVFEEGNPVGVHGVLRDVTERVESESARRENEERLKTIGDRLPHGAIYQYGIRPDGSDFFTHLGAGIAQNAGHSAAELMADTRRAFESILPEDRAAMVAATEHSARTLPAFDHQFRRRRPDGSIRRFHSRSMPRRLADGTTLWDGVEFDITDHKEADDQLRESEARLQLVMDLVPHFIFAKDAAGRFLFVNRALAGSLGMTPEEMIGRTDNALFASPEQREGYRRDDLEVIASGRPKFIPEETGTDRSGNVQFLQTIKIPFTVPGTGAPAVLGVAVDITERKNAEEKLRASEEQFQLVARAAQDAIWDVDLVHQRAWWNETYDRLLGPRPKETATSWDWWIERIHPGERQRVVHSLQEAMADPGADLWSANYHFHTEDGAEHFLQDRAHISRDAHGRATRIVGSMRDQTALELAMQEREKMERKILETQKLESLGVLAGGIAHDFNNLLTAMLGNVSLIKLDLPPSSEHMPMLLGVEQAALRAADLCRQMLAYAGKGRFVIEPLDLNTLVEGMIQLLKVSITKNVHLRIDLAPGLPPVRADSSQLNQVIMNLVINASEAIGSKDGLITLTTGSVEFTSEYAEKMHIVPELPAGLYAFLEVSDNGCGMDYETLQKIFDPFFSTKFTGRGLGLAAVQGILRGHKGALKVYSERDRGTTFKILLPTDPAGVAALTAAAPPAVESGAHESRGLILVVDDEEFVRVTAKRILARHGYEVIMAGDGAEGLELLDDKVQAVLLDLTMPRMDGVEAFRLMRLRRPQVPILLMSGYNEQDAIQRFTGKGLAGFVRKPFETKSLIEKIAAAIRPTGV